MTTHPSRASLSRTTALVYVRVSRLDDEERDRKVSPAMQREKALALSELEGLRIEHFEDIDISGRSTTNRPGYLAMMGRLARGDVRYVVAYDLSRATRTLRDQADFFEALDRSGALFLESATGRTIDPNDEDEELGANVLGSVNQHARRKTARRVRDSLALKVAHGELVGPVPAGYRRRRELTPDGTKVARLVVEPDPATAPTVRLIFAEYATGTYSYRSLATALNARVPRPPLPCAPHFRNGRGNRPNASAERADLFTADVLKDIIRNPRYVGRVPRRDGSTFKAAYEPLIDEETWNSCVRIRMRQSSASLRRTGVAMPTSRYLLSGVLRCAVCGSSMSGKTRRPDRTHPAERYAYTCYRQRVSHACRRSAHIEQELLETEVRAILEAVALPDGLAKAVDAHVAAYFAEQNRETRTASLKTIDARLARLRDMYELGDIERGEYLRRRDELEAEHDRATLAASKPRPVFLRQRDMLRTLVDDWDHLEMGERRKLVEDVFAEVRASADGLTEFVPRDEWKPYVRVVVPKARRVITGASSPVFRSEVVGRASFLSEVAARKALQRAK